MATLGLLPYVLPLTVPTDLLWHLPTLQDLRLAVLVVALLLAQLQAPQTLG